MSKHGDGSVFKDSKRGTFRAFFTDTNGNRRSKRFASQPEAIAWKNAQLTAINSGTYIAPSDLTIGEWVLDWLETYKKPAIRVRTFERYKEIAAKLAPISGYKLQELTAPIVQNFYHNSDFSANMTNKVHKLLKAAINKATVLEFVSRNVMLLVEPPKLIRTEIKIFTKEEINAIIKVTQDGPFWAKRYRPFILLAITTGARLGELLGLRWCDFNAAAREIHIRQQLQQTHKELIILPPKTQAGVRKIAIPNETVQALQGIRNTRNIIVMDKTALIFQTRKGTPISPRNLGRMWKSILREAKVPYKNFHVLRHTHATELLAIGVPIIEVSRRLGHARVSHTLDLYGHAIPNYDKSIADKIKNLYVL